MAGAATAAAFFFPCCCFLGLALEAAGDFLGVDLTAFLALGVAVVFFLPSSAAAAAFLGAAFFLPPSLFSFFASTALAFFSASFNLAFSFLALALRALASSFLASADSLYEFFSRTRTPFSTPFSRAFLSPFFFGSTCAYYDKLSAGERYRDAIRALDMNIFSIHGSCKMHVLFIENRQHGTD